jgi:hypothetical protein
METDTFPRRDVQEWLTGVVCLKINAGGDNGHPLADKFRVEAFPTLVLLDPLGKVLHNRPGAPLGDGFVEYFSAERWNAAVEALNLKDWKGTAPHLFFVRKFFPGTKLGKQAEELCRELEQQEGFTDAYEAARKAHEDALAVARKADEARLAKAREAEQKEQERRAKAKALKAEADELFKKYLKTKAYDLYRKILAEYPDLPEADEAEAILRKNKQKLSK